ELLGWHTSRSLSLQTQALTLNPRFPRTTVVCLSLWHSCPGQLQCNVAAPFVRLHSMRGGRERFRDFPVFFGLLQCDARRAVVIVRETLVIQVGRRINLAVHTGMRGEIIRHILLFLFL